MSQVKPCGCFQFYEEVKEVVVQNVERDVVFDLESRSKRSIGRRFKVIKIEMREGWFSLNSLSVKAFHP